MVYAYQLDFPSRWQNGGTVSTHGMLSWGLFTLRQRNLLFSSPPVGRSARRWIVRGRWLFSSLSLETPCASTPRNVGRSWRVLFRFSFFCFLFLFRFSVYGRWIFGARYDGCHGVFLPGVLSAFSSECRDVLAISQVGLGTIGGWFLFQWLDDEVLESLLTTDRCQV